MPVEVSIWRIDGKIEQISFGGIDYESRLQQIIADDISIVDPGLMAIGREVATSYGGRIDILAMDGDGSLVVVELKRALTPREVVAQALDYASWVRHMATEEIAETFLEYQRGFLKEGSPQGIDDALLKRFGSVPDELNTSHRMVIVAGEIDPATERIVTYLQEEHGVDINVVFFRSFQDDQREYLTRAWLKEPGIISTEAPVHRGSAPAHRGSRGEWNGEFYCNYGTNRDWDSARKYGYVSAGGGDWYSRTLRFLQPGSRVWVKIPGTGYVGVGVVTSGATHYDQFNVEQNGSSIPLSQVKSVIPSSYWSSKADGEYFVGVNWIKTVSRQEAVDERGFFGNQNTVAQPRAASWNYTVERLKSLWGVQ